ncbi:MAG: oxygen-independent coproporphyrinogen III oxidase [Tannerellaceae bacterium]|nr:oxygen-independent coproporphyrinogen III oxidase [Tannerellaceae bacterium]
MKEELLQKYNIPVPRYTSYPPANYFHTGFTSGMYEEAILQSNETGPRHLSFYIHIPFCRHLCHYCGCNSFPMRNQEKVDQYVAALHKEIAYITKKIHPERRISQIHYGGGSPTCLPAGTLQSLNDRLLSSFRTIDQPEIAIECHPGYLVEKNWQQLVDAGFNRFSLGIQDFNREVLKVVNRRPSLLPVEEIMGILRSGNATVNMDLLYGLPLQTVASFSQTVQQAVELQPDRLVTFSYGHVPWVSKRQLILEKTGFPPDQEKSRIYESAKSLLTQSGYKTIGLDHFVRKEDELYQALEQGMLHRNFQGYCTRRTTGQVYAFGVTGISQLDTAYIQNSKEIDEYIHRIESGSYAVSKGYKLNREEQVTREVIQTLMCNYRVIWKEIGARLSLPVEEVKEAILYDEQQFASFAEDGIITWDEQEIRMTEPGALFVRNVAASMDRLMQQPTRSFSKPV